MKRVLSLFRQDLTMAFRDNLIVFILIAPMMFSLLIRGFIPTVEATSHTFAVTPEVRLSWGGELDKVGDVLEYSDLLAVEERVLAVDDVLGIHQEAGLPVFILEGTESPASKAAYDAVMQMLLSPAPELEVKTTDLGRDRSPLTELLSVAALMMATLMGGIAVAFNIVHEKETGAIRALAVSPLNLFEFILARGIFTVGIGFFISLASALILTGGKVHAGMLLLAVLASGIVGVLFSLVIGGFGSNQISAIAIMKGAMPVYMGLPIIASLLAEKWQPVFWILPPYWQYQMLANLFGSGSQRYSFGFSFLLTIGVSLVWLIPLARPLKQRFHMRRMLSSASHKAGK